MQVLLDVIQEGPYSLPEDSLIKFKKAIINEDNKSNKNEKNS